MYTSKGVRMIREKLGLSQSEFAALTGVLPITVKHWESGLHTPSPLAHDYLIWLDVSVDEGQIIDNDSDRDGDCDLDMLLAVLTDRIEGIKWSRRRKDGGKTEGEVC